ncbi:nuclear receptor subfamily 2 group C member 1-A-like [Centruroides sculpturatus]|uniref:nuclear receptor subfamily 2 group C member 1-A-like n=1 Tax=Centruroides sculpturatus TaxID=218467 RepID=UPI000C6E7DA4|nr:nuclear receptor subfamily 2 group C member 1-A-like [Centruroides sculpturatus]
MMSDSHLNNTCLMNGRLESEDNEDDVSVALQTHQCKVCGDRAVSNYYGAYACISCRVFFDSHVRLEKEIISCVTRRGNCSTNRRRNIITCDFCRFSKCHDVNLKHEIITSSPRFVLPPLQIEDEQIFLNYARTFTKCMKYMEQYYYKWLNSFPSFRRLSEERKELRDGVNEVITDSLPRHLTTVEACNILKLHLILEDDVLITDKDLQEGDLYDFLDNIIQMLMEFMTVMHEEFETEENFEQIESLSLFDYSSDIPEDNYPYNQIRFVP